jgi:hypothetical protein
MIPRGISLLLNLSLPNRLYIVLASARFAPPPYIDFRGFFANVSIVRLNLLSSRASLKSTLANSLPLLLNASPSVSDGKRGSYMFRFINDILEQFLPCFNRQASWVNFCVIIIGFIMRSDTRGVSSVISVKLRIPERYTTLLKFFRSTSFASDGLYKILEGDPERMMGVR